MTNIRRYLRDGQFYFLTHVTHNREPILIEHFDLLWRAFEKAGLVEPERMIAWVALPDHVHMLINPLNDSLPNLVRRWKLTFSASLRSHNGQTGGRSWQYRYWDHIIRDEKDLNRHIDYIHYNPVKHGLTDDPFLYHYSSLEEYFERGVYSRDWGVVNDPTVTGDYGE